jgi:uncharacterized membrane protein YesL
MNESYQRAFESITGTAYVVLMTNILVGIPVLPIVLLYVTADLGLSWHALVAVVPLLAPLLTAAFGVLTRFSEDGETTVIRTFVATVKATFRSSLIVGLTATIILFMIVVDIGVVWSSRWGALVIPILAMLTVLVLITALTVLVALAVEPEAKLRLAWKASLALAVRRWYLSAMSLVVLAVFGGFAIMQPAFALGLALTPALYLVWANARFSLRPVLPPAIPAAV